MTPHTYAETVAGHDDVNDEIAERNRQEEEPWTSAVDNGQTLQRGAGARSSLHIEPGEVFASYRNGSGKTTAINRILQLLTYDKGTIELFGQTMRPSSYDLKRRIGIVPQNVAVFEELTVRENIDTSARCT
ncbi:MAG: ATP-binding cassette domain-containing protein [Eggerthella lenta]